VKNVVSIVGARPQFVKAGALSRALASQGVNEIVVHTGQHYDFDMSALFFEELGLPEPSYNLGVGSGSHGKQTARMLEGIESVLVATCPEMVVTFGDTNSTLAGALAAAKLLIPMCHVEAGLRSFNRNMPEEINRVLTDHAADLLFAPTAVAVQNLRNEGIAAEKIVRTGDVMYDATLHFVARAEAVSRALERLELQPRSYILATFHRSENTDDPTRLRAILEGLADLAEDLPVIVPLHPRTREEIERQMLQHASPRLALLAPFGYLDMTQMEKNARLIVTDSGGVQKEAYFHAVPCVTLRRETEWTETLAGGCNQLVFPSDRETVRDGVRQALEHSATFRTGLYGDGRSAVQIATVIAGWTQTVAAPTKGA
jgi:UDP-GlcNAc3NAcA epimerase